jgi:hypothetical protein
MNHGYMIAHAQARGAVIVNGERAVLVAWRRKRSTSSGPKGSDEARVLFAGDRARTVPHSAVSLP